MPLIATSYLHPYRHTSHASIQLQVRADVFVLEFSGPSCTRGEIQVCRTTTKQVDWHKHMRNQYIQHCIYI